MKLLGTFLGLSAANKLRFGAHGCEDGPAFWCDGLSKATQCSATEYCTKNEWNAPTKPDSVCESCRTAVGLAQMYLTDNKTRTEVEDILDYACQLSDEANQERCLDLIHKETDVLFDFIQKVTDPDTICSAIQLCSAATEEEMLAYVKKNLVDKGIFSAKIQTSKTEEKLAPIPIDINLKTSQKIGNFKGPGCDICKLAVAKIDIALEDKKTQGEVMDLAEEACDVLPSEYSDQCKAAIEMYGPQIIKMLEAQLDPNTICNTIGLCEKLNSWKAPAKCTEPKMIGMCRALVPSYFYNKDNGKCEYFGYGGCGGNSNRFNTEEECRARCEKALGLNTCDDCKLAVVYLKNYLSDPANEKSVIEALDKVCDNVPSSFVTECQDFVDTYGTELLKYSETLLDENFVCEKMQLCSAAPPKQKLLGANECTFGPSHWCASHENAKSCGATDFCLEKGLLEPEK